ncbi:MAG TPA: response regulator [Verrucomicrobiae bacterium]|nr:response regulator [Verrucomicrobiae bacterium]
MGKKVLVVDDELPVCGVLNEFLGIKGFQVLTSTSTRAALEMVDSEVPDAVVMDLLMPEMDGLEALMLIKKKHPELPVVILTGAGYDVEIMKSVLENGADGFVSKGVFLEQLLMELHRVMKRPAAA